MAEMPPHFQAGFLLVHAPARRVRPEPRQPVVRNLPHVVQEAGLLGSKSGADKRLAQIQMFRHMSQSESNALEFYDERPENSHSNPRKIESRILTVHPSRPCERLDLFPSLDPPIVTGERHEYERLLREIPIEAEQKDGIELCRSKVD
jgi:hypothetical protein